MIEKWPIGVVTLVAEGIVEYTAKHSDLETRISNGRVQVIKGIGDFIFASVSTDSILILRVFKSRLAGLGEDERESAYVQSDKVVFSAEPIGELGKNGFISGAGHFPLVGDNIFAADDVVVERIFSSIGDHLISLGTVNNYDNVHPDLNLGKILTSHIAILGNTGSGKSTTLRALLQKIGEVQSELNPLVSFFVFDVHGDYEGLSFAQGIDVTQTHLPLNKLELDDWAAALMPSERTQKPLLSRSLSIARVLPEYSQIVYALLTKDALENTNQDSLSGLKRLVTKWIKKVFPDDSAVNQDLDQWVLNFGNEEGKQKLVKRVSDFLNEYPYKDVNEIINIVSSDVNFTLNELEEAFEVVFGEEEVKGNNRVRGNTETFMARFRNFKSRYGNSDGILNENHGEELTLKVGDSPRKTKIYILNLVGLDDDALRLVSTYLARQVFEFNKRKFRNKTEKDSMPFDYLYLDEAHRYVRNSDDESSTIFETIAREGRKFSVYLGVVSQIPNELSKVVMSQTGAFLIHRIQNALDLDFIKRNVPAATSGMVDRLPSLPSGTALLSGSAFDIPFEINILAGNLGEVSKSRNPIQRSK